MIFKVEKLDVVNGEIAELQQEQQDLLKSEYELIETKGIEFVRVKHLQGKIFEIKSKNCGPCLDIKRAKSFL